MLAVATGEKLLVRANFAAERLKNGDIVTVKELKGDGSLSLQDGRTIPAYFRQFTHGYAATSHTAQGKTVDHGILVLGKEGYQAANLKQAYVSNSRFSHTQTIFTTDKQQAFESMARLEERSLAMEVVRTLHSEVFNPKNQENIPLLVMKEQGQAIKLKPDGALDWNPLETKKIGLRF